MLHNVTLVCVTSKNIEGHQKALEYSRKGIMFADAKLIERPEIDTIDKWNHYMVYELGSHIDTDFALIIHDDGFVVNPDSWRDEWLQYDYIGSPFPLPTDDFSFRDVNGKIQRVGNSVSLRSKKLMDLPKKISMDWKSFHGYFNEDGYITVNMRHEFEKHSCKFAPFEEAVLFGRECPLPENKGVSPFVFHRYNGENSNYPKYI